MARPVRTIDRMNAEAMQVRLAALGHYSGAIDADPGPKTEAAIVSFKVALGWRNRLKFTGSTLARLYSSTAPAAKRATSSTIVADAAGLPWMQEVAAVMGWHENEPRTKRWLAAGVVALDPRKQAWCGDGIDTAFARGLPKEPTNPRGASARSWERWGVGIDGPAYGCVVTFWRGHGPSDWRGHVGFVVGIKRDKRGRVVALVVRGANQDNRWKDSTFKLDKVTAYRWPSTWPLPKGVAPTVSDRMPAPANSVV